MADHIKLCCFSLNLSGILNATQHVLFYSIILHYLRILVMQKYQIKDKSHSTEKVVGYSLSKWLQHIYFCNLDGIWQHSGLMIFVDMAEIN